MSCPPSLLPPSSPSLPIHMPSAWSCDSDECVIWMVGAHHAHHAQRVICTHLMPTLTSSLPLPAVPLCMCRHGSAAVMPCGSDCIHWRCWWLPLPFHFFFLLPFQLLHRCVTRCVCVLMEGERGCVFRTTTPPASCQQLQAGGCLFVLVAEGRRVCHCACGCTTSSPSPCYAVLFVGASMAHAAHTQPHPHFCLCNMGTTQATDWQKQTGVCVLCVQLPAVVGAVTCTV